MIGVKKGTYGKVPEGLLADVSKGSVNSNC